jgi:hypothetical protein
MKRSQLSSTSILPFFCRLDKELTGDIRYQTFMDLLVDNDFMEITHSWLMPKQTDAAKVRAVSSPSRSPNEDASRLLMCALSLMKRHSSKRKFGCAACGRVLPRRTPWMQALRKTWRRYDCLPG